MINQDQGVAVVGAGLAGATLVQALRDNGFQEPVTLIGEERQRPYERPALSKDYLQGKTSAAELYVHADGWYAEHGVTTRFGETVHTIDRHRSQLSLDSGEVIGYRQLVLATGATPRRLQLPGADLDGICTLRRIEDAERLRAALGTDAQLVIIGGGWIGLEVAAAARLADTKVTVLEASHIPLSRILGTQIGAYFAALHRSHGVTLHNDATVHALLGADGHVTGVETDRGVIPADLVLVAVGAIPNTSLGDAAGIRVDNGIVVDEHLRSSDAALLAVGDAANAFHPSLGRHLRVEHWDNAIRQGQLAAATILGRRETYDWQPYFYTDQFDLGMEYVGHGNGDDDVVIRGDLDSGEFLAFWTRHDHVTAAMNVNIWDVNDQLRQVVGRQVPPSRLQNTAIPLDQL